MADEDITLRDGVTGPANAMAAALDAAAAAANNSQAAMNALANAGLKVAVNGRLFDVENRKFVANSEAAARGVAAESATIQASMREAATAAKAAASAKAAAEKDAATAAKAAADQAAGAWVASAKESSSAVDTAMASVAASAKQAGNASANAAKKTTAAFENVKPPTFANATKGAMNFGQAGNAAANAILQPLGPLGNILEALGPGFIAAGAGLAILVVGLKAAWKVAKGLFDFAIDHSAKFGKAIRNAGTKFEDLMFRAVSKAQPAFDAAAAAIDRMVNRLMASPAVLNALVGAFETLATVIEGAAIAAEKIIELFDRMAAIEADNIKEAGQDIEDWSHKMVNASASADAFNSALSGTSGAFGIFDGNLAGTTGALSAAIGTWTSAGADLVAGFVAGITSAGSAAIDAAMTLGQNAASALKSALGIGSPSKVAQDMGENVGVSFGDAMNDSLPDVTNTLVGGGSPANDVASGAVAGGATTISIVVNVTQSNATASDIEFAVARGVQNALRQRGAA